MNSISIKFSNKQDRAFTKELKTDVDAYFKGNGISQKANIHMVIKTISLLSLLFVPYGLIMSGQVSTWGMWPLTFLMGLGAAGIGFSVAHDALHGAYSSNKHINALLGFSFDVMGASSYIWKLRHNMMHHTYTNIKGADVDVEVSRLIRLSPGSSYHPVQRYQRFYAFFAYGFTTLHWLLVKDFVNILRKDMGPYRNISHTKSQVALVFAVKLAYYFNTIVLPLLILDITWWQYLIGFATFHFTAGTILTVIFQLAHVVEGPAHYATEGDEVMADSWMVHQMKTTSNFARDNRLLSWYIGGLNFQIEHHLFPRVCSIHYAAISPIVKRIAEKHGVPYYDQPTLRSAIASHYRTLKRLGQPGINPETYARQAAK